MMVCVTEWSCVSEIYNSVNFNTVSYSLSVSYSVRDVQVHFKKSSATGIPSEVTYLQQGFFSKGGRKLWVQPNFTSAVGCFMI